MPVIDGAEAYAHDGGAVGVLVLHGLSGSPKGMRPWAEHLAAAGYTVRLPRLPGHGTTWQEMALTRWDDWYTAAERALDDLLQRCDQVFVMGLSMGGTLALRLAQLRGDDIAGLVLVNPAVHTRRFDARYLLPLLQAVVPKWPGIVNDIKKPGQDEGGYATISPKASYSLVTTLPTVEAELPLVTQPLLVFSSTVDHVVETSNGPAIVAGVSSTDVERVELPDSYHVATLDNDAQTIFDGSVRFVARLTAAAG
jgi:carboxylesterase